MNTSFYEMNDDNKIKLISDVHNNSFNLTNYMNKGRCVLIKVKHV